jgi:hypothetical protein
MMEILASLEATGFSTWVKESSTIWAYPTILTLHTVGLGVLVGAAWAVDLRVLGVAQKIPLDTLAKLFPIMWIGFWVNTISGVVLFAADATTKGTTTIFMWKLGLIVVGVLTIVLLRRDLYKKGPAPGRIGGHARLLAVTSLLVWMVAIAAGRFMAYV